MPDKLGGYACYEVCMPCVATDRHRGRRHVCPICGDKVWSAFGHARRHWERHTENERAPFEQGIKGE